jgi:hypothetical protein
MLFGRGDDNIYIKGFGMEFCVDWLSSTDASLFSTGYFLPGLISLGRNLTQAFCSIAVIISYLRSLDYIDLGIMEGAQMMENETHSVCLLLLGSAYRIDSSFKSVHRMRWQNPWRTEILQMVVTRHSNAFKEFNCYCHIPHI